MLDWVASTGDYRVWRHDPLAVGAADPLPDASPKPGALEFHSERPASDARGQRPCGRLEASTGDYPRVALRPHGGRRPVSGRAGSGGPVDDDTDQSRSAVRRRRPRPRLGARERAFPAVSLRPQRDDTPPRDHPRAHPGADPTPPFHARGDDREREGALRELRLSTSSGCRATLARERYPAAHCRRSTSTSASAAGPPTIRWSCSTSRNDRTGRDRRVFRGRARVAPTMDAPRIRPASRARRCRPRTPPNGRSRTRSATCSASNT